MKAKRKGRVAPRIDLDSLENNFASQIASGAVYNARLAGAPLPPLHSARDQRVSLMGCVLDNVSLADTNARQLLLSDVRLESSDLANIDCSASTFERVEIIATRLTGAVCNQAQWKSVLFRECRLDLIMARMAAFEECVFEDCNLTQADFYAADLTGAIFRRCDLSCADIAQAKLTGADIRDCRIDGVRGMPGAMEGLIISPEQAALLITLFGVTVKP
ncbi:MAG TPA: pentapeptide repeat-containing protein [Acidobacteriaceae bacterium]|jgi:uncharacterized protein YjbI with pentapeptide repeats